MPHGRPFEHDPVSAHPELVTIVEMSEIVHAEFVVQSEVTDYSIGWFLFGGVKALSTNQPAKCV